MNVELLREVKDEILKEPAKFDMGTFVSKPAEYTVKPPCGTVGCIAGWAMLLRAPELRGSKAKFKVDEGFDTAVFRFRQELGKALGIRNSEQRGFEQVAGKLLEINRNQRKRLFYVGNWPEPFQTDYLRVDSEIAMLYESFESPRGKKRQQIKEFLERRAQIAADRIEHFIETGK